MNDVDLATVEAAVQSVLRLTADELEARGRRASVRARRMGDLVQVTVHVNPFRRRACLELTVEVGRAGPEWVVTGWVGDTLGQTHDELSMRIVGDEADVASAAQRFANVAMAYLRATPVRRRTSSVRAIAAVAEPVVEAMGEIVGKAARGVQGVGTGPNDTLRRRARRPLPSLFELYPEARRANRRELGLRTVPVAEIRGTAVEVPGLRRADFLPVPDARTGDWKARWGRIRKAVAQLAVLPPVTLFKYGEDYWVDDGHNRVAAALYNGQLAVDAAVIELLPIGSRSEEKPSDLAAMLVDSKELRAAGAGRFSITATAYAADPTEEAAPNPTETEAGPDLSRGPDRGHDVDQTDRERPQGH